MTLPISHPVTNKKVVDLIMYGAKNSIYEYVKLFINEQARQFGISVQFSEIDDWEIITRKGIESIPSVQINNRPKLSPKKEQGLASFLNELKESILIEGNYGNLEKLIVPVDFSEVSENTFAYASALGKKMNSALCITHIYYPKAIAVEGAVFVDHECQKNTSNQLHQFIEELKNNIASDHPILVKDFRVGLPGVEIVNMSKEYKKSWIVIGSSGDGGLLKKLFGSVTLEVAKNASCPVMVIPPGTQYAPIRKIVIAYDDPKSLASISERLSSIVQCFDSEIHLVHVSKHENHWLDAEIVESIKANYPTSKVVSVGIINKNIISGLNEYIESHSIDLLVMPTEKRAFVHDIFHQSVSQKMTGNTKTPLLIIQNAQES